MSKTIGLYHGYRMATGAVFSSVSSTFLLKCTVFQHAFVSLGCPVIFAAQEAQSEATR